MLPAFRHAARAQARTPAAAFQPACPSKIRDRQKDNGADAVGMNILAGEYTEYAGHVSCAVGYDGLSDVMDACRARQEA